MEHLSLGIPPGLALGSALGVTPGLALGSALGVHPGLALGSVLKILILKITLMILLYTTAIRIWSAHWISILVVSNAYKKNSWNVNSWAERSH